MKIACLGWGSLVWDPRGLPIRREWFRDGPLLPIEFARESKDGRVTLVLFENAPEVRCLWSLMSIADLEKAKVALADREGLTSKDKTKNVGCWKATDQDSHNLGSDAISKWARMIGVDAVIWTSLEATFKNYGELGNNVLDHLKSLGHEKRQDAERYVRQTPRQIDTQVRRLLEQELGWLPNDEAMLR